MSLVGGGRQERVERTREQPQQRQAEDERPVAPQHPQRPADGISGLVARRRGGRRRGGGRQRRETGGAVRGHGRPHRRERGRRRLVEVDPEAVVRVVPQRGGPIAAVAERVAELGHRRHSGQGGRLDGVGIGRGRLVHGLPAWRLGRRLGPCAGRPVARGGVSGERQVLEDGVLGRGVRAAERRDGAGVRGTIGHEYGGGPGVSAGREGGFSAPAYKPRSASLHPPLDPCRMARRPYMRSAYSADWIAAIRTQEAETEHWTSPRLPLGSRPVGETLSFWVAGLRESACSRHTSRTGSPRGLRDGRPP